MPKADINKVYNISFDQSLQEDCFDKVEPPQVGTYFVFSQQKKEKVQDQAKDYVQRDSVDKKLE